MLAVSGKKQIVFCNAPAAELFQAAEEKMTGRSFLEVTQSLEMERFLDEVLLTQKPCLREIRLARTEEQFLLCQMLPVSHEGDGVVCIFQNVTRFFQLERVRRDFAANVSHELKTPVAAMKSLAETLLRGAKDDADVRDKFIASLHHEAERLSSILQDLLDLLRLESGEFHLQKKSLSLRAVCGDVMLAFKEELAQKNLQMEIQMTDALPEIFADESGVKHILDNLVDNAVKYTPEGGKIVLRVQVKPENEKEVIISVQDTGAGIPSMDLPRIFERFYRVDKARSRELGGTGLGLSIVKHLVEAHGGRVWAESHLNRGSTFYFTLPL